MVKKKLSGQTIAILILAALLVLTIGFGGVFAFYTSRTNKVSGKIVMANLKINLEAGGSDRSEIIISNGENVVPNQALENSPLTVQNLSNVAIYLMVVYELNAVKNGTKEPVEDKKINPVIDLGYCYINPKNGIENYIKDQSWVDYVYTSDASGETKTYRILVNTNAIHPETDATVIAKDRLKLSRWVTNEYQDTTISFTFQAYAIGTGTFETISDRKECCKQIVDAVYENENYRFLQVTTTM